MLQHYDYRTKSPGLYELRCVLFGPRDKLEYSISALHSLFGVSDPTISEGHYRFLCEYELGRRVLPGGTYSQDINNYINFRAATQEWFPLEKAILSASLGLASMVAAKMGKNEVGTIDELAVHQERIHPLPNAAIFAGDNRILQGYFDFVEKRVFLDRTVMALDPFSCIGILFHEASHFSDPLLCGETDERVIASSEHQAFLSLSKFYRHLAELFKEKLGDSSPVISEVVSQSLTGLISQAEQEAFNHSLQADSVRADRSDISFWGNCTINVGRNF